MAHKCGICLPASLTVVCLWLVLFAYVTITSELQVHLLLYCVNLLLQATALLPNVEETIVPKVDRHQLGLLVRHHCNRTANWGVQMLFAVAWLRLLSILCRPFLLKPFTASTAINGNLFALLVCVVHALSIYMFYERLQALEIFSAKFSREEFSTFCIKLRTQDVTGDFLREFADRVPVTLNNPYLHGLRLL